VNDEQLEAFGAWMSRVEILLERIAENTRRIEGNASCIDAGIGDLTIKVGELFQAVDGIQAGLCRVGRSSRRPG